MLVTRFMAARAVQASRQAGKMMTVQRRCGIHNIKIPRDDYYKNNTTIIASLQQQLDMKDAEIDAKNLIIAHLCAQKQNEQRKKEQDEKEKPEKTEEEEKDDEKETKKTAASKAMKEWQTFTHFNSQLLDAKNTIVAKMTMQLGKGFEWRMEWGSGGKDMFEESERRFKELKGRFEESKRQFHESKRQFDGVVDAGKDKGKDSGSGKDSVWSCGIVDTDGVGWRAEGWVGGVVKKEGRMRELMQGMSDGEREKYDHL